MRGILIALALSGPAAAQVVSAPVQAPALDGYATKADVQAVQATIPQPAAAAPPMEMVGGSVGTAGTYRPADAATPRITRAGTVTTDATGAWSIAWSSPLASAPVVIPIPVNASTQPIVCNVSTRTMTAASGKCWLARTLPATILALTSLITYDVFGAAATGITVQVVALPPTQP